MIEVDGVGRSFDGGRTWAVRDVTMEVDEGATLAILGSSGSGKSTLLRMINGMDRPCEGCVRIGGANVAQLDPLPLRRSIGFVLQDVGLFSNLSVAGNVEVVPRLLGWSRAERRQRAEEMLELVGLPPHEYARRHVATLSGGQRQRVGIARALAGRPKLLLMDEPFSALDAVVRAHLHDEVEAIRDRLGVTIMLVTHDPVEAVRLGHVIAVMHEGRLVRMGTWADIVRDPGDPFVASLVSRAHRQAALLKNEVPA